MSRARQPVEVTFAAPDSSEIARVEALSGDTLLDAALDHGIEISHECGGNCSCTTCLVYVLSGAAGLSPAEDPEVYRLQFAESPAPNARLSCQALLRHGRICVEIGQAETARE